MFHSTRSNAKDGVVEGGLAFFGSLVTFRGSLPSGFYERPQIFRYYFQGVVPISVRPLLSSSDSQHMSIGDRYSFTSPMGESCYFSKTMVNNTPIALTLDR